ncbi:MAG: radical SAM protein [Muribaculaceae bacterium]|nr:radical SAM protein [Muribaculaceae bacterium]
MLIRQSKNTFIRFFFDKGYITNQLTRFDRVYNDTGADFLREISREPKEEEVIIDNLQKLYGSSVCREDLKAEFMNFVDDLVRTKFLVIGETEKELDANDLDFSYSMENPKTMVNNFSQDTKDILDRDTQNLILKATQRQPRMNNIQFELTGRCNERCIHCYLNNSKKDNGKDLPVEKVKSIIDEYADNQGLHVTLSGGEMLMHKDILEIIRYCREKDMIISLLSNLMALRDDQIPVIKEANVSAVQVSLYSMDPEIHDYITTVRGSFVRTKRAIEKLVAADIPVMISCPVMKANREGYKDVLKYAQSLKCKANTDFIMMAQSDMETDNLANRLSIEETELLLRDIIENDPDYHTYINETISIEYLKTLDIEAFKDMPLCGAGINECCIGENGDVFACAGWQAKPLGNVYQQSLMDIWYNSPVAKEIRAVTEGDFPKCLSCEARDYCARCLVRNFNESGGDMFKLNDHFCKVAFLNKRLVEEYQEKWKKEDENM